MTAVDSSILYDVIAGSPEESDTARAALARALEQGVIVVSTVVYAELAGRFADRTDLDAFLEAWRCRVDRIDVPSAYLAGVHFKRYRRRGGTRERILPDFLIAAHAELNSDRVLTRGRAVLRRGVS